MRSWRFLAVVILVLALIYTYLSWSLGRGTSHPGLAWLLALIPVIGILTFPVLVFAARKRSAKFAKRELQGRHSSPEKPTESAEQSESEEEPRASAAHWLAYLSMAGGSFLLPILILRDLAVLASDHFSQATSVYLLNDQISVAMPALATLLLIVGSRIAARGLYLKRVDVPIELNDQEAEVALDGFKIAQISDLHIGPTIDRNYVQKTVDMTNSVEPDIIVLTGDIGDGSPQVYQDDFAPLKHLRAKLGVFYVTGNHEYYSDAEKWMTMMTDAGMVVLRNSNQIIHYAGSSAALLKKVSIAVAGVVDPAAAMFLATDGPKPADAMLGANNADIKILLAHQPGIAALAEKAGFDLQISGHTHGGQFFPWNFVVKKVHQYHQGLFKRGVMHIYVSPGTGSWGPPIRLGTRPEVSVLTLRSQARAESKSDFAHGQGA